MWLAHKSHVTWQFKYSIVFLWSCQSHQMWMLKYAWAMFCLLFWHQLPLGVALHKNRSRYSLIYGSTTLWHFEFIFKTFYKYWLCHLKWPLCPMKVNFNLTYSVCQLLCNQFLGGFSFMKFKISPVPQQKVIINLRIQDF